MHHSLLPTILLSLSLPLTLASPAPQFFPTISGLVALTGGLHPETSVYANHASALSACAKLDGSGEDFCEQTAIGYNGAAATYLLDLEENETAVAAIATLTAGNIGPSGINAMVAAIEAEPTQYREVASSVLFEVASLQGVSVVQARETAGRSEGAASSSVVDATAAATATGGSSAGGAAGSSSSHAAAPGAMQTGMVMGMAGVAVGFAGLVIGL